MYNLHLIATGYLPYFCFKFYLILSILSRILDFFLMILFFVIISNLAQHIISYISIISYLHWVLSYKYAGAGVQNDTFLTLIWSTTSRTLRIKFDNSIYFLNVLPAIIWQYPKYSNAAICPRLTGKLIAKFILSLI